MIPVSFENIIKINLDKKTDDLFETKYMILLKKQLIWLRKNNSQLYKLSKRLYDMYLDGSLPSAIVSRCCNFQLLEEKCAEYNKK